MFETIAQHIQALPLAVQLIAVMVVLSVADFAMAVIAHLRAGDIHLTILGEWIRSKGLPIVTVALLFGLDSVLKLFAVNVGNAEIGAIGGLAALQAGTFIIQEAASVVKNAKLLTSPPPAEDPVPEE